MSHVEKIREEFKEVISGVVLGIIEDHGSALTLQVYIGNEPKVVTLNDSNILEYSNRAITFVGRTKPESPCQQRHDVVVPKNSDLGHIISTVIKMLEPNFSCNKDA